MAELVYREEHENMKQNPREMSVRLNFSSPNESSLSNEPVNFYLMRLIHPNGVHEYFYNEQPLLADEYAIKIVELNLHIQSFCAQQGRIEELCFKDGKGLTQLIEEISGSIVYKKKYDDIKNEVILLYL